MNRQGEIWAIDFDETLSSGNYPFVGVEIAENIKFVKQLKKEGAKLILWTCREDHNGALSRAVRWCEERGLKFDAVNDNLPEITANRGVNSRKICAHYYFDDRGINATKFVEGAGL